MTAKTENGQHKILSTCVDFFDYCYHADGLFSEHDIDVLMGDLAAAGFARVYWRVSAVGRLLYPTKVASMYVFDGRPQSRVIVNSIRSYDMLATGAKYARRHNLAFIPWLTILDDDCTGYSCFDRVDDPAACPCENPLYNPFLEQYPHVQKKHLFRDEYMQGVLCYAEPDAVAFQQAVVAEIMEYDVDGILFSIHSHVSYRGVEDRDLYGFNAPVLARYRDRYGVDLRQNPERLDMEKALAVRASFWDEFLQNIWTYVNRLGRKFIMMIEIPDALKGGIWHDVNVKIGRYQWNWPAWIRAGGPESLILNTVHGSFTRELGDWLNSLAETQAARFILSYNPLPDERIFQPEFTDEYRDFILQAMRETPISELCCYETQHLSRYGNRLMGAVAAAHAMLAAEPGLSPRIRSKNSEKET
jgi:uncharacterized lipoprotein YddW (UPF0748 family)